MHLFLSHFFTFLRRFVRWAILFFFASSFLAVIALRWIPVYYSPLMFIRCVQQKLEGESLKLSHHWVPLEDIPEHLDNAVIASEDNRFPTHHGFDFDAIMDAAEERLNGERFRGGSTITQQTAKNVFLWPNSSWVRKGFETYFTVLIDVFWSKERQMEVYLNTIEMGDGIYGAQAVAKAHFQKDAKDLTRGECALIAASLPNPLKFNSGSPSSYMYKRRKRILRLMKILPDFPQYKTK
ncbi:MAG: monofunctional biosynthetic peptidoglycan transglycosylase [Bacteroidaceae bacterium]